MGIGQPAGADTEASVGGTADDAVQIADVDRQNLGFGLIQIQIRDEHRQIVRRAVILDPCPVVVAVVQVDAGGEGGRDRQAYLLEWHGNALRFPAQQPFTILGDVEIIRVH